jgi:hypothetical protein
MAYTIGATCDWDETVIFAACVVQLAFFTSAYSSHTEEVFYSVPKSAIQLTLNGLLCIKCIQIIAN